MSIQITDGLRQLYCPQINTLNQTAAFGLRYWLLNSNSFITASSPDNSIELSLFDSAEYLSCLAKDIDRLSTASIETVSAIQESPINKKFLAWQIIELYYAAFFSAHSTLKACGFGLTQIDTTICTRLKKQADLFGYTISDLNAGIYCIDYIQDTSKIKIYKVHRYDDSHRGLWQRYSDFLNVLNGTHIKTGLPNTQCIRLRGETETAPDSVFSHLPLADAQQIIDRLDLISRSINKRGDNNWLSYIRNCVNYNHQFGVWYPYSGLSEDLEELLSKHNRFLYRNSPMSSEFIFDGKSDINEFSKCCHLIIALNREILYDIASRHPSKKSFLDKGALHLDRKIKQHH